MSDKQVVGLFGVVAAVVIAIVTVLIFLYKVPAGNVGIKVNLLGSEKGVQIEELGVGRYWIGINEELFLFPTFTQNVTWSDQQTISFQTKEGMKVAGAVGLTYHIDPTKAAVLFQKYRTGVEEITDKFLRNMVRDAFNEKASTLNVESVYGAGKSDMLRDVEESVRAQVKDIGINIERIYYASDLILPQEVTDSLNAKIRATQMAEQRQNEVKQSIAEADKERERARGVADAMLIQAKAEAESIKLRSEAISKSQNVILLNAIDKWDGTLPKFISGDTPLPILPIQ